MKLIIDWIVKALILLLTTYVIPGFVIDSFVSALIVVVVLGLLSVFVKPLLVFISLPINFLTLGLFTFVINAVLLYIAAWVVPGFSIDGFVTAILAALVMAILSALFSVAFNTN